MILVFNTGVSSDPGQAGSIPVRLRWPSDLAWLWVSIVMTCCPNVGEPLGWIGEPSGWVKTSDLQLVPSGGPS